MKWINLFLKEKGKEYDEKGKQIWKQTMLRRGEGRVVT